MIIIHTGILIRCHLAVDSRHDATTKLPFSSPAFFAATVLDPNYALLWVDVELATLDDSQCRDFELEIRGGSMMLIIQFHQMLDLMLGRGNLSSPVARFNS